MIEVTVENHLTKDHEVQVHAKLNLDEETARRTDANPQAAIARDAGILVKAGQCTVARIPMTVDAPLLWDDSHPNLYQITAVIEDRGSFTVRLNPEDKIQNGICDKDSTLFGIRTITVDPAYGLQINGTTVKLKGGCIHHDNGLLGAVSLHDSEYRKCRLLKDAGFNAVRMVYNPPSRVLLEVCDRLGLYVFDEAFDAWGHGKRPGDYNQFFHEHWQADMAAFIKRDRSHPSVIIWSTGNEVDERGGIGNGYAISENDGGIWFPKPGF